MDYPLFFFFKKCPCHSLSLSGIKLMSHVGFSWKGRRVFEYNGNLFSKWNGWMGKMPNVEGVGIFSVRWIEGDCLA